MIRVSDHLAMAFAILERHGASRESLVVVANVQQWCKNEGVEEPNPHRAAKCFYWPDRCLIVIQDEQSEAMIKSAKDRMELDGFSKQVAQLRSPERYLEHLLLHEVACLVLQTGDQAPRDQWAFEQLGIA